MLELCAMRELMDQFAVNAPSCPSWFEPEMEEKPAEPPLPDYLDDNTLTSFKHQDRPEIDVEKYPDFAKEMGEYWASLDEWKLKYKIEKLTQWPYFYAQALLDKRLKITEEF